MSSQKPRDVNQQIPIAEPLVEVRRGAITESRHRGHVVAAEPDGNIVAYLGDPANVTYLRSSAKPLQALPLLISGAAEHFGFTDQEVALACGSHSGEAIHTATVASMLSKIGLGPEALRCGTHEPFSPEVSRELRAKGEQPNVLQNNCSGKHAGMLALALHLNAPTENYDNPQNPVQLTIGRIVAQFSSIPLEDISIGIDGCGVPVFGITVKAMALAYARLVSPPVEFGKPIRDACQRIVKAMTAYPELGVLPCEEWPSGLGLALKIEDGDDHRARPTVVIESLRQLGVLHDESLEAVSRYAFFPVRNRREEIVGEIRASFSLRRPEERS